MSRRGSSLVLLSNPTELEMVFFQPFCNGTSEGETTVRRVPKVKSKLHARVCALCGRTAAVKLRNDRVGISGGAVVVSMVKDTSSPNVRLRDLETKNSSLSNARTHNQELVA